MRAQILMNMASKDKYKSLLERYKQALIKNPKLNLSAYCRLNGVSVSGMHHYIVLATIHRRLTKLSKHPPLLNFFVAIREYRYAYCRFVEKIKPRICTNLHEYIFVIFVYIRYSA